MATIFKHPALPDDFVDHRGTGSLVDTYEAGKIILLPELRPTIDHDFWASLPVDTFPALKKLSTFDDRRENTHKMLARGGIPESLSAALESNMLSLLEQVVPTYLKLFEGYEYLKRKIVWRLTPQMNENMHVDAYDEALPDHFARMFINLDVQPRIWQISHPLTHVLERYEGPFDARGDDEATNAAHFSANEAMFGAIKGPSLDRAPYHVAYFDPGEVWVVDSRQVAHQIFYGRRAVSIDFRVDPATMRHPERQYLATTRRLLSSRRPNRD